MSAPTSDNPQSSQQESNTIKREANGYFAKGHSANPSGRARMPQVVKDMLSSNTEKAVSAIVKFIDDSDPRVALKAAELLLDRAHGKPQQATETIEFELPEDTGTTAALVELHASLLRATASGAVSVADARELSGLFENHRRLIEVADLEQRLSKLEKELKNVPA